MLQGRNSGAAVRRVYGVRDGDATDPGIEQPMQSLPEIDTRIRSGPEHESAGCVAVQAAANRMARLFQAPRVLDVGREEHVERCAVLNLCEEIP